MRQLFIADDNIEFAKFIATVARSEGWSVETCANGKELLEKMEIGVAQALLLVDIQMPEMDGIEVIEGLIDLDRPLRLRFMTGGLLAPMIAANLIAKARDLVVGKSVFKPISKDTLIDLLRAEAEAMGTS